MKTKNLLLVLGVLFFCETGLGLRIQLSGINLDGNSLSISNKTSCQSKNWKWHTPEETRESRECFCCLHKHALVKGSFELSQGNIKPLLSRCQKKCSMNAVKGLMTTCTNGRVNFKRPPKDIEDIKPFAFCVLATCLNGKALPPRQGERPVEGFCEKYK